MRERVSGRIQRPRAQTRAASREFHTAQSSGCERYYDSGFEVTLELTFSYIVSLSVSENVSGVAIIAAFWRTLLVHVKYPHETPD